MRPIGLLLCVSACTLDNPAFRVTDTEGGSASSAASADPTRPTSTTNGSTTASSDASGSTTDEPATTASGTSANVSDSAVTTEPPATSSTTDETTTTTTTTDPQPMTATGDTTGPVSCGLIDVIPPLLALGLLDENQTPTPENCAAWQGKEFAGKLEATLGGFKVLEHQDCPSIDVPADGFKFDISLPDVPSHNSECVKLRFAVHPGTCLVSFVTVTHGTMPVLTGSFGRHEFEPPFVPQYELTDTCGACPGCCAPGPDPGTYDVKMDDKPVVEGGNLPFEHQSKQHLFYNVRAHVHGPECLDKPSPADWLHFDWVVLRLE
ncbi:hypothetical protein OV203_06340 [Nannocystis sp. ILAH1]|uniref:hypothetical protein n=1 Tax=unclassified Nannocystis TaxID=2627009 RepID=UPI002270B1D5|nr:MULTISPECIES: hypothetical protein [unclassified Nannocystis]MCY0986730.1 hypothetical protein [Nannocystis sp. ILAH1]MCY1071609.1 hypothetical protein [Nannocystis sp. RBIL2]